ncbi:MAG: LamG domain-containing protein [Chloroflexaceae bacterium]|nr:LamG domain-containing protein [Chloroflexaceae bacterium]
MTFLKDWATQVPVSGVTQRNNSAKLPTMPGWTFEIAGESGAIYSMKTTSGKCVEGDDCSAPGSEALVGYFGMPTNKSISGVGRTSVLGVWGGGSSGPTEAKETLLTLPMPLPATMNVHVRIAIMELDAEDSRIGVVTARAGGKTAEATVEDPGTVLGSAIDGNKFQLNIVQLTLNNVPAGTQEVYAGVRSPKDSGDSFFMLGAVAWHSCDGTEDVSNVGNVSAAGVGQPEPPATVGEYTVSYEGMSVEADGSKTFAYHVSQQGSTRDLSNWVLEMPGGDCLGSAGERVANFNSVGTISGLDVLKGQDSAQNSGFFGIKWEGFDKVPGGFTSGLFKVNIAAGVAANVLEGETGIYTKGGTNKVSGTITGPVCKPALPEPFARYDFNEGSGNKVNDSVGGLNLTIANPGKVVWVSGGLRVTGKTIIQSSSTANSLVSAAKASNELTVEAWVNSESSALTGPPRMVTLSTDTGNGRDFTLLQDGTGVSGRVKTTGSGYKTFTTSSGMLPDGSLHHVVLTVKGGVGKIYVDGVEKQSQSLDGSTFSAWSNYSLALANEVNNPDNMRYWKGTYYKVAIYTTAYTADQVQQLYNDGP